MISYDATTPLAARLEVGYSKSNSDSVPPRITTASRQITFGVADIILSARSGAVRPYGLAGAGIFNIAVDAQAYDPFGQIPPYRINIYQTVFGFNVGGGISVSLGSRTAAFADVRYAHAATSLSDPLIEDGLGLVQLIAGISF